MPTSNQKVDFIFKKTLGKGDTLTNRDYYTETDGREALKPEEVWVETIPATKPSSLDFQSGSHLDTEGNLQLLKSVVLDLIPGSDFTYRHDANRDLLLDVVDNSYGDGTYNYLIEDAQGAKVDFGVGDWIFDLETGQLRFYDPDNQFFQNLDSSFFTITCIKYIGDKLTQGVGSGSGSGSSLCSEAVEEGTNVAPSSVFIQSNSNLQATVGVINIVDEDPSTEWVATLSEKAWIRIDMGSGNEKTVRRFKIRGQANRLGDFTVYGSNLPDPLANSAASVASDWEKIQDFVYEPTDDLQGFILDNENPYRWYLFYIHSSLDPLVYPIGLQELELYETLNSTHHGDIIDPTNERCYQKRLALYTELEEHISNVSNPHNLTVSMLGGTPLSLFENHINNVSLHLWDKDRIGLSLIENVAYVKQSDVGINNEDFFGVPPLTNGGLIPSSYLPQISSGLSFLGVWNALTNTGPELQGGGLIAGEPEPPEGSYYVVSQGSTTRTVDGTQGWEAGDWIIKGSSGWFKIENAGTVFSVNGLTGHVNLETDQVPEGLINLYFTDQRVQDFLDNQGYTNQLHLQNTDTRLEIDPLDPVPLTDEDPVQLITINSKEYLTSNSIFWHIQNDTIHTPLDDSQTSSSSLWSSQKTVDYINSSPQLHIHDNKSELDKIQDGDHERREDNPHNVTKADVGLSLIENALFVKQSEVGKYGEEYNGVPPLNANNKVPLGYIEISGGLKFKGMWDPITNTPELSSGGSGEPGAYYIVKNTGNSPDPIDGFSSFDQGQWIVDSGGFWDLIDGSGIVISVNGKDGAVELTTQDIPEDVSIPEPSRNLYFTDTRVSNSPDVALNTLYRHEQNTDTYLDIYNNGDVKTSVDSLRAHLENQYNPTDDDGEVTPRRNHPTNPRLNATNPHDVQFDTLKDVEPYYLVPDKSANSAIISLHEGGFSPVTQSDRAQRVESVTTVTTPSGSSTVVTGFIAYSGIYAFNNKWNSGTTQSVFYGDLSYNWRTGSPGRLYPANEDEWVQVDFGAALAASNDPDELAKLGYYIPNKNTVIEDPDGNGFYSGLRGYIQDVTNDLIYSDGVVRPFSANLIGFFDPRMDSTFDFSNPSEGDVVIITRTWTRSSGLTPLSPVEGEDAFNVGDFFLYTEDNGWTLYNDLDTITASLEAYLPDSLEKGFLHNFNLVYPEDQGPGDFEDPEYFKPYVQKVHDRSEYPGKVINAIKLAGPSLRDFSLFGSWDGENWIRLLTDRHDGWYVNIPASGGNLDPLDGDPNNNFRVYPFNNNKPFRFYRLTVHNSNSSNVNITRIELLEDSIKGKVPVINKEQEGLSYTNLPPSEALFDHLFDQENPHKITPSKIGAPTKLEFKELNKEFNTIEADYKYHRDDVWNPHVQNTDNPHETNKVDVGLSEVDNVKQIPFTYIAAPGGVAPLATAGGINAGRVPYEHLPLAFDLRSNIVDNLESTRTDLALSANQGRHLHEIVESFKGEGLRVVEDLDEMVQDAHSFQPNLDLKYLVKEDSENDNEPSIFVVVTEIPSAFNGSPSQLDIDSMWSEFGDTTVWNYNDGSDIDNIQYTEQLFSSKNKRELSGYQSDFSLQDFSFEAVLSCTRQEGGELGLFIGDLPDGDPDSNVIAVIDDPSTVSPEKVFSEQSLAETIQDVIADASVTHPNNLPAPTSNQKYFLQDVSAIDSSWGSLDTDINGSPKALTDNSVVQYVSGTWRVQKNNLDLNNLALTQDAVSFITDSNDYFSWDSGLEILSSWSIPTGGGLATAQEGHRYLLKNATATAASWGDLNLDINFSNKSITDNCIVLYSDDQWLLEYTENDISSGFSVQDSLGNSYTWNGTSFENSTVDNLSARIKSVPMYQYEVDDFVADPSTTSPNISYKEETHAIVLEKLIVDASTSAPGVDLSSPVIGEKYFLQSVAGIHPNWGTLNKDLFEDDITLTNNSYIQYTALGWRVVYNSTGLSSATIQNGGILSFLDSTDNSIYTWNTSLSALESWTEPLGGGLAGPSEGQRYVLEDVSSGLAASWGTIDKDLNSNPTSIDDNCIIEYLGGEWRVVDRGELIDSLDSAQNYIIRTTSGSFFEWNTSTSEFEAFTPGAEDEVFEIVLNRGSDDEEVISSSVLRTTASGWDSVFYRLLIEKSGDDVLFRVSSPSSLVFDNSKDVTIDLTSDAKYSDLVSSSLKAGFYSYQLLGGQVRDIKTTTFVPEWNSGTEVYFKPVRLRTDIAFQENYKVSTSTSIGLSMSGANQLYNELYSTKVSVVDFNGHLTDYDNPHRVTPEDIGLGNVINELQVTKSEVGAADGVAPLNSDSKVPNDNLPIGDPNGIAPLDNSAKIENAYLNVNVEDGFPTLDSNLHLDSSYFLKDTAGGFVTVQNDGFMLSELINPDELPFPQLSESTGKVEFSYLSINGPSALLQLDSNAEVEMDYLKTNVAEGVAKLDQDAKVDPAQLHVNEADGLATLDSNTKVSLAYLYAGETLGLATLDGDGYLEEDQIPPYLLEGLKFKGFWSGGSDPSVDPEKDDYYIVDQNNSYTLDGFSDWVIGDWVIYLGDSQGWYKLDNNRGVLTLNGFEGIVDITTDEVPEGASNLYYTDSRVQSYLDSLNIITNTHQRNEDQFLDEGGSNEISASDLREHVDDIVNPAQTQELQVNSGNTTISLISDDVNELYYAKYDKPEDGNPHETTALAIGSTPLEDFVDHVFNFNNPHRINFKDLKDVLFKGEEYDLTTGLPSIITASSAQVGSDPSNAIDDTNQPTPTFWYALSDDQEYVDINFGSSNPHRVVGMNITAGEFGLSNYTLYGSNDETAIDDTSSNGITGGVPDYIKWEQIENWPTQDISGFATEDITFTNTESYSYYRLYIHSSVSAGPIGIQDLQLFTTDEILQKLGFRYSEDFESIIAGETSGISGSGSGGGLPDLGDMETVIGLDVGGGVNQTFPAKIIKFEVPDDPLQPIDGTNDTFSIENSDFIEETLEVYVNGLLQMPIDDYQITNGVDVVLTEPPLSGSKVWFNYWNKITA